MTYNILSVINTAFLSAAEEIPPGTILGFDRALLVRLGVQWLNVAILTAVMIYILYNPVKKFMAERTARIKGDIDSARQNNEDSRELRAKYEGLLTNIGKEREEILDKARREANNEHDRIVFAAQEEAKHIKSRAEDEIRIERENAADEIRTQIVEISTLMASRFIEMSIDHNTQDKYINEALADWSGRKWQA